MNIPFSWPPQNVDSNQVANRSNVAGRSVTDALNTLLTSGGAVSSVFGRTGAVAAALNDYVASLIGNDSAVSGATVKDALNTIAAAIVSLVASQIGNNSSVSGATVKDALNTLFQQGAFISPYLREPSTPSAWDFDAKTATNPDLAANGWTVRKLDSPFTTISYAGPIPGLSALSSDAPPAGYYASLINGVLVCKFNTAAGSIQISKATDNNNYTYKSHVWGSGFGAGACVAKLLVGDAVNWNVNGQKYVYMGVDQDRLGFNWFQPPGSNLALINNVITEAQSEMVNYLSVQPGSPSGLFSGYQTKPNGTSLVFASPTGQTGLNWTPVSAGLWIYNPLSSIIHIESIRRLPYNTFP